MLSLILNILAAVLFGYPGWSNNHCFALRSCCLYSEAVGVGGGEDSGEDGGEAIFEFGGIE